MADDPTPTPDPEPTPDSTPDPQPDPTPDPDPDPTPDTQAQLRAENQRLKREAAEREKEKRKAEAAARKAEETRKADQGQWKELAEEREREIETLKGQITERDQRDAERDQRSTVETVAEKLNYRRPKRAFALLLDELGADDAHDTLADEQLTEAALRRMAKDMPELVDSQRRSGAPVGGRGNGAQPSAEEEGADFIFGLLGRTPQ